MGAEDVIVVAESGIPSDPHHGHHDPHHGHPGLLVMPTSPLSVTTASMSASDDMIENENEMLRDRYANIDSGRILIKTELESLNKNH